MAGGFLNKLIGRSSVAAPDVQAAVAELERLAVERPELAPPAALLADILPAIFERPAQEVGPPLAAEQATAKLSGGVPLLRGEPLATDERGFDRHWHRVCDAMQRHQPGDAAAALAAAKQRGQLDAGELMRDVIGGRPDAVRGRFEELGLDVGLGVTVLRLVLFPILSRVRASLAPLLAGSAWPQGYCPACGSWPLLGEFRGLEQTRWLRCGLCAAEWTFARLCCPFCGTRDHRQLGYLHVEGEESRYRAATCEECRGYVKMVSTLSALSSPQLLVADVATTHLDLIAAGQQYVPPLY